MHDSFFDQAINYPTVPRGEERLRITPGPYHKEQDIKTLTAAMVDTWAALKLPYNIDVEIPVGSGAQLALHRGGG